MPGPMLGAGASEIRYSVWSQETHRLQQGMVRVMTDSLATGQGLQLWLEFWRVEKLPGDDNSRDDS